MAAKVTVKPPLISKRRERRAKREANYYTPQSGHSLDPNAIIRRIDGPKFFGFGQTQIDKKIASGDIPKPVVLSEGGRASGWLGSQIIEHQQQLLARATKVKA
jgi:predicted DNA-binding transcriptional regulator AlpA